MSKSSLLSLVTCKEWQAVLSRSKHASIEEFLAVDSTSFNQNSLHIALRSKAPNNVLKCLISSQSARQRESRKGYLPLHYAIRYKSSLEIIHLLIDVFEEAVEKTVEKDDLSCLHLACFFNLNVAVIDCLLKTKPSLATLKTKQNATALHIACRTSKVSQAIIKRLLKVYPKSAQETMNGGWSALHLAILHEASFEIIFDLVLAFPYMVFNITSSSGQTPLGLYWTNTCDSSMSRDHVSLLLNPRSKLQQNYCEEANNQGLVHQVMKFPQEIPNLMTYILNEYPDHSKMYDSEGRLPLHVAIELKEKLDKDTWKKIFVHNPAAIHQYDRKKLCYPFMIAAHQDDLDLTYQLICLKPCVIEQIAKKEVGLNHY